MTDLEKMMQLIAAWKKKSDRISREDAKSLIRDCIDLESQLIAIKVHLQRNKEFEKVTVEQIEAFEEEVRATIDGGQEFKKYIETRKADAMCVSKFLDATRSMSATSLLAPFVESLFVSIFIGIRKLAWEENYNDPRKMAMQEQYWNPRVIIRNRGANRDIVKGIVELAESTNLHSHLPKKYEQKLEALFLYRNNMFHYGLEWPLDIHANFAKKNSNWPKEWFIQSEDGDEPIVFYISEEFIAQCLNMVDNVLIGVGLYLSNIEY